MAVTPACPRKVDVAAGTMGEAGSSPIGRGITANLLRPERHPTGGGQESGVTRTRSRIERSVIHCQTGNGQKDWHRGGRCRFTVGLKLCANVYLRAKEESKETADARRGRWRYGCFSSLRLCDNVGDTACIGANGRGTSWGRRFGCLLDFKLCGNAGASGRAIGKEGVLGTGARRDARWNNAVREDDGRGARWSRWGKGDQCEQLAQGTSTARNSTDSRPHMEQLGTSSYVTGIGIRATQPHRHSSSTARMSGRNNSELVIPDGDAWRRTKPLHQPSCTKRSSERRGARGGQAKDIAMPEDSTEPAARQAAARSTMRRMRGNGNELRTLHKSALQCLTSPANPHPSSCRTCTVGSALHMTSMPLHTGKGEECDATENEGRGCGDDAREGCVNRSRRRRWCGREGCSARRRRGGNPGQRRERRRPAGERVVRDRGRRRAKKGDDWARQRSERCWDSAATNTEPRAGGKAYLRVGEATNPGPEQSGMDHPRGCGALTFRDPGRPGFRHTIIPSASGNETNDDVVHYQLVIDTVNGTAWGPIARYLVRTTADLVLCQEHHLGPAEVAAAAALAQRIGWQPLFVPATPGEGDGWRGGVAIFARRGVGLSMPKVGHSELIPARAIAALVEAPGYRPFTAVSAYLEHGKGLGSANLAHLRDIGNFLEAQGQHAPFVVGGDFQCPPDQMANAGFARRTAASIVATCDPRGTCRSTTATTEIDYYVLHDAMTRGLQSVELVEGAGTAPHVPVRLTFKPRLTSARSLVLRKPPPMAIERVFGPLPMPPDWTEVKVAASELVHKVRQQDFVMDNGFRDGYADMYTRWSDLAEKEIIAATVNDTQVKKEGLRGRPPVLVWRSIQSERPPPLPPQQDRLDGWRTLVSVAHEIRGALLWLLPNALSDRWIERSDADAADHDDHQRRVLASPPQPSREAGGHQEPTCSRSRTSWI